MDFLFDAYSEALPRVEAWAAERFPRPDDEPEARPRARASARRRSTCCAGCCRRPRSRTWASSPRGQAYEQLLLRLFASPLPEARDYASMILEELKAVMPSFVARVERPERGGEWISYLERARARGASAGQRGSGSTALAGDEDEPGRPCGCCRCRASEEELLAALLFEAAVGVRGRGAQRPLRNLPPDERAAMLAELVGERRNRRHRPGRGFEALRYRFEVVSDYGAFRDLQRHRLLTVQWQTLGPELGAGVPDELDDAGVGDLYREGLERSRAEHARHRGGGPPGAGALRARARATGSATCST